jgi:hypothetical protein
LVLVVLDRVRASRQHESGLPGLRTEVERSQWHSGELGRIARARPELIRREGVAPLVVDELGPIAGGVERLCDQRECRVLGERMGRVTVDVATLSAAEWVVHPTNAVIRIETSSPGGSAPSFAT